jgi:hypothetical protein
VHVSKSLLWAAIGSTAVLIVVLLVGGVLFVSGRSISLGGVAFPSDLVGERSTGKRVDLDTWAATICAAGETYVESITTAVSPVDPTTMELTERKANAAKLGKIQVDSARALVTTLRTVVPPEPALAYHRALIASERTTSAPSTSRARPSPPPPAPSRSPSPTPRPAFASRPTTARSPPLP